MKRISLLTFLVLFAFGINSANGQIVDKFLDKRKDAAKKSAFNRLGREADKEVDKGVNKGLDKIFGEEEADSVSSTPAGSSSSSSSRSSGSSSSGPGMNALMGAMGISTGTANVKPLYEFDGFVEMTITNYEKGKAEDESVVYKTYTDSKSLDYGMEFTEEGDDGMSIIIFDAENGVMLTLADSDGEKTGFAIAFNAEQNEAIAENAEDAEDYDPDEYTDPYSTYKTGKTKKILGYSCDEYRIENEEDDDVITMWITNDLNKDMKKTYLQNSAFTGLFMYAYAADGAVMEYIIENKSNDDKTVMTVTDIDLNKRNTISTSGYTIMNMGAVPEDEPDED